MKNRAARQERLRRQPDRLPGHDPAAVQAQRPGHPLQRLGHQGRLHVLRPGTYFGEWKRSTPRASGASSRWRPRSAAGATKTGCSTWSRTSSPSRNDRADWSRSSPRTTSTSASTTPSKPARRASGQRRRRAGSASSGTPRAVGQVAVDAVVHPEGAAQAMPGNWTFVMVTDRKELDDQLYEEFADSGAITAGVEVHAETSATPARAAAAGPPLRLHADPQVHHAREGRRPCRCCRTATTSSSSPTRPTAASTTPLAANMRHGAAQRLVPRLHRHPADRRGGAGDPRGVRRLRVDLQLPRRRSRTAPRSRSTTRTASPSCSSSTRTSTTSWTTLLEDAELDEDAGGKAGPRVRPQYHADHPSPTGSKTIADDLVEHFVGRGFVGKAMYVAHRQGHRRAHVRQGQSRLGRATSAELESAARTAADELERPAIAGADRARWRRPTWRWSCRRPRTRSPSMAERGLDIRPHRKRMNDEDLDDQVQGPRRPAPARVRVRHVDHRLRRAVTARRSTSTSR